MLVWSLLTLLSSSWAAVPEELRRYHELAMAQSETLQMAKSRQQQAEERKSQALGTLFPNLNARYTYTEIDPPPGVRGPFTRINQYSALVNLNQPIYRGAAVAAYQYTKDDIKLQARLAEQTGLGLWQEVALAYYSTWIARNDYTSLSKLRDFSDERVKELKERVRVGRSRKGELNQAEAQLRAVDAQLAQAQRAVSENEERLAFLTGRPQSPNFGPMPAPVLKTAALDSYLTQARSRPDLLAKRQEIDLTERLVDNAKAGHHPTIDFNSNYYFERTGILQDSEWDIGVAVNVPIFQGGTVQGQVREQVEKKREVILGYERLKREIDRDIRILWHNSTALDKVVSDLRDSLEKARATYEANKRDYAYGLVTNLDVLLSMNQFIETKQSYERAVIEKELTTIQITLATGVTP